MNDNSNIVDLKAEAKKRGKPLPARAEPLVSVTGNNNVAVAGDRNHINIHVKTSSRKHPRLEVMPGPGQITEAQAAEIQELVTRVVGVSRKQYSMVWSVLKRNFRFNSYRMLPKEQFEEVRQYLRKWIASASPASTTQGGATERKRLLARIHAEARKTPGLLDRVHEYARGRFGTSSLSELSLGQLTEVIRQFNF